MQVANEPTVSGIVLKPAQEAGDLLVRQVVGELRTDDEVEFLLRFVGKRIAVDEVDVRRRQGGFPCRPCRPGVEVDAGQSGGRVARPDFSQGIAMAAGDVQHGKVTARPLCQP